MQGICANEYDRCRASSTETPSLQLAFTPHDYEKDRSLFHEAFVGSLAGGLAPRLRLLFTGVATARSAVLFPAIGNSDCSGDVQSQDSLAAVEAAACCAESIPRRRRYRCGDRTRLPDSPVVEINLIGCSKAVPCRLSFNWLLRKPQ